MIEQFFLIYFTVEFNGYFYQTALQSAVSNNNIEIVKLLSSVPNIDLNGYNILQNFKQ